MWFLLLSFNMENANNNNTGAQAPNPHPGFDTTTGSSETVVASFDDTSGVTTTSVAPPPKVSIDIAGAVDADLARFFERPVQIGNFAWSGLFANTTIKPWELWATNAAVSRKLANYSLFRGNLHLRVSVNGTPMQFGMLCAYYQPGAAPSLPGSGVADNPTGTYTRWSQLRHVMLSGSGTSAAELVIPFFYTKPYAEIYAGLDWALIGRLSLASVVDLQTCNGGVLQNSTVNVSAWVTDAVLRVPTALAAGPKAHGHAVPAEQKPRGAISAVASTVATVAGALKNVPFIGAYARATEMAATVVGGVASVFGYSKPSGLVEPAPMLPIYVGTLATTQGPDGSQKLSADIKQELDIGNGTLGLPDAPDELAISSIASRSAIVAVKTWATTDAVDASLATLTVTPMGVRAFNNTTGPFYPTPVAFAAMGFQYWTGSLIFRIQVVASPMMTGRVLVSHIPEQVNPLPTVTVASLLNTSNCCVLDVNDKTDIEFVVHMSQSTQWLPTGRLFSNTFTPGTDNGYNGRLNIRVLNELTAPAPCSASIVISVRAGPDFKLAGPQLSRVNQYIYSAAGPQTDISKAVGIPAMAAPDVCDMVPAGDADVCSSYFGESIVSLRGLAKRFSTASQYTLVAAADLTANQYVYFNLVLPFRPKPPINSTTDSYNFFTWATWASLPFRGTRGGSRWKFKMNYGPGTRNFGPMSVNRYTYGGAAPAVTYLTEANLSASEFGTHSREADGAAIVDPLRNTFVEVEDPYSHDRLYIVPGYGGSADETVNTRERVELGSWVQVSASGYSNVRGIVGVTAISAAADDFTTYEWVGVGELTYVSTRGGSTTYTSTGQVVTA